MPGELIVVPALHGSFEFTIAVRKALERSNPQCIAVELPETLRQIVLRGVSRLPLLSVVFYRGQKGLPIYLPIEPVDPAIEALRFGLEHEIPVHLVDMDVDHYGIHREIIPDPYACRVIGFDRFAHLVQDALAAEARDPQDEAREAVMACHVQRLLEEHQRVLFVCGLSHALRIQEKLKHPIASEPLRRVHRSDVTLYHLSAESSREITAEPPFLALAFETARNTGAAALDDLDRLKQQVMLAQNAREIFEKQSGETVSSGALSLMFRFARNYALVEGRLAPDLYQLLVAARGAIDDNYAYELWKLATTWPYQSEKPGLEVIHLGIEDLYQYSRYIRFHRKLKTRRKNLLRLVKVRHQENRPGEWKEGWQGEAICSHQPEDYVIESYGDFIKRKAKGLISAKNYHIEPFSTSLFDGIDVRETLRNWYEGRLYVRENRIIKGEVGAVIVIFDEDLDPAKPYDWCITWQGEHEQESDMALYATRPGEKMVGPGISRCEYGGFLLTTPSGRMFDVFEDPFFNSAESKPERLLLAGIDFCRERLIVYVAARPPRSFLRSTAEKYGKKIVYLPLGDLSPVTLKKIRTFHVLDGYQVRTWAKDYIGY